MNSKYEFEKESPAFFHAAFLINFIARLQFLLLMVVSLPASLPSLLISFFLPIPFLSVDPWPHRLWAQTCGPHDRPHPRVGAADRRRA